MRTPRVLFVCLGNICRSPTAEAVFRKRAADASLDVETDSAGTSGCHAGEPPDPRSIRAGKKRGYNFYNIKSRMITEADFHYFDHILAMDMDNFRKLSSLCPHEHMSRLRLFADFAKDARIREIPDPYYAGTEKFESVLDLCEKAGDGLIALLKNNQNMQTEPGTQSIP
ncbi:MAG: low molecular weight phosphotyrosine protein phosphatase [Hyphomonadaceae bacterium]|nr:low molecular weight phosphotyrosine protein phosphatase [Hyphomonadaceae bacterium]